jgi:uncharacterized membrane protein
VRIIGRLTRYAGVPAAQVHQEHAEGALESLATVGALFAGGRFAIAEFVFTGHSYFAIVTATTLQFSYSENGDASMTAVNFFWFSSLVLRFVFQLPTRLLKC